LVGNDPGFPLLKGSVVDASLAYASSAGRVVHFDGALWNELEDFGGVALFDVHADASVVAVAGAGGFFAVGDTSGLSTVATGTTVSFAKVWVAAENEIYLAGNGYLAV
jgi:hypothetical protein